PQILARDVILWDAHVQPEAQRRAQLRRGLFALQPGNGALQHLRVQIETDRFDVPVLLPSQQVARAPQLQVQRRNAKSRPEFAEFFHRRKPLARHLRKNSANSGRDFALRRWTWSCGARATCWDGNSTGTSKRSVSICTRRCWSAPFPG